MGCFVWREERQPVQLKLEYHWETQVNIHPGSIYITTRAFSNFLSSIFILLVVNVLTEELDNSGHPNLNVQVI